MTRAGGIFLFGVGAPKSGTSWLHDFLAVHPEVFVPPMKELHFFNSVDGARQARMAKLEAKRARYQDRIARGKSGETELAAIAEISALTLDGTDDAYIAYMTKGARDRQPPCKVMADITPAYGLLSVERLKRMQGLGDSRFIYLMRDPVARMWSHIRMNALRQVKQTGADLAETCDRLFGQALRGKLPALQARGDYARVLNKLSKLDPKRVLVAFYEELFTDEAVSGICRFLGISAMPARLDMRVNQGRAVALADTDRLRAADYLKPQYDAVQAHMGRLPDAWKQNAGVA